MQDFFKPDIPDDAIYHVGVSGGKDSGAVLLWMVHESGIPRHQINATFCDTGHEHDWTYAQIETLSKHVHPIETLKPKLGFFELAENKQRFPSSEARFCTQNLKIFPTQDHVRYLLDAYKHVVAVSGVRSAESYDRAKLLEWDYSGNLLCIAWRPLITWKIEDVLAIHAKYGIPMNKLYEAGSERVGCFPCIMCKKKEIRSIAIKFPERIDLIRNKEREFGSSFFTPGRTPKRFHSGSCVNKKGETVTFPYIDDVVKWSMTGKRAKGSYLDDEPEPVSCSSGFCE
ncbi:MAG: hypothetical protein QG619_936 [Pseudomonadota bacterium]|nr:hypothetical protein [Pseudomonadota bacterium]